MASTLKWGLAIGACLLGGVVAHQGVAQAAQNNRLSATEARSAVAQAIRSQCPAKARQISKASCSPMGFDGDRHSCRYEIEDRFGSQTLWIDNSSGSWKPTNTFNMCDMPPLAISARPQKAQLNQAIRRDCGRSALSVSTAICSPKVNASREDTYTCRYSIGGTSGQQSSDIYLRRGRWNLAERGEVCPSFRVASDRRDYRPARDYPPARGDTPGRFELAVAMFDVCPGTARDLSSVACEATGEPSEFSCIFRTRDTPDPDSTIIARDGESWALIDIPNTCRAR